MMGPGRTPGRQQRLSAAASVSERLLHSLLGNAHLFENTHYQDTSLNLSPHWRQNFATHVALTWREDVWVEANVERRVANGADCLAGVEDNLAAFGICLCLGSFT